MKYKPSVYTQVILIVALKCASGSGREGGGVLQGYEPERVVGTWNESSETSSLWGRHEEFRRYDPAPDFYQEVSRCIKENRNEITEDVSRGKGIILECFKTTLVMSILARYLGDSSQSSIKLFNGLLEFRKLPEKFEGECEGVKCEEKRRRDFEAKKSEYLRMYKKAMQKLIDERNRLHSRRNFTEEEKTSQLNRIDENSQAFLSEVVRNLENDAAEKREEEKLAKEMSDPRLLSVLDALTRSYMLRFKFYPGIAARMMRSNSGGFTFDLEIQEPAEGLEEESSSDESATREIKDMPEAKDYFDDDDDGNKNRIKKKSKKDKKKKKEMKKKGKKLKKIIPYLLLPMLIQVSLLPFVFKKLFFLAMKALFAGKVALILVGFNILRNTCINREDEYQKIRVEHYGYGKGEEYGAWINGRSLPSLPFAGQKPLSTP